MPTRPDPPETVGAAEIALLLGLSRQRVTQLTTKDARQRNGFPEPWLELRMGQIWLASDVRDWAERNRREIQN